MRFVGKETSRPDAPAKATGQAEYIHDLSRPGMLYGKIKFSDARPRQDQAHRYVSKARTAAGCEGRHHG